MMPINLFCSLLAILVTLGPVAKLGLPRWAVALVGLALVGLAQQVIVHRIFRASVMSPDGMPLWLEATLLWGTAFLMATGGLTVLWWVARWGHLAIPGWVPLAIGAALAFTFLYLGERLPPVKEREAVLPGLPAEADGLRVAVLADVHIDSWRGREWCERLVARVNAAKPDLILFTGDQADGPIALRREDIAPLAKLEAPLGKFLISGNHEHYFETEAYLKEYERLGITILEGRAQEAAGLWLVGLPDGRSLTRADAAERKLRDLMAQAPKDAFPVLLVHKPGIAPEADELGVRLQLSGHTHGGQLPGVASLIARYNRGFVRGWYDLPQGMRLFVAPGTGVWLGFPYRLYPSEITLLTLRRGD